MDHIAVDPHLQAEADAYQSEYEEIQTQLHLLNTKKSHNRQRGQKLIEWMRSEGVRIIRVGSVILRRHQDDRGFDRIALARPRPPHGE